MGYEEKIHEAALALGGDVAGALEPARVYRSRAEQLSRELAGLRSAEERASTSLVSAVAAGKTAPSEIPAELASHWPIDSPASMVIVQAAAVCHRNATASEVGAGPALFTALQKRVASVVQESTKLVMSLPEGVNTEMAALRASNGDQRHFKTWSRLDELLSVWEACHELNRLMQEASWLPKPDSPYDRPGARTFQAYKTPHRLATIKGPVSLQRHLAAAVAVGAEPGLYPWPDAVQRWERLDRTQRDYRPTVTYETYNSQGMVAKVEPGPESPAPFKPAGVI